MASSIDEQIAVAEQRGLEQLAADPRAVTARYESDSGRISVELTNGCAYVFPARLVQELRGASPTELTCIEVDGLGYNLHWPALDADLYVPALIAGVFGTRAWMAREFERPDNQSPSLANSTATRGNGSRGGRSRKAAAR